MKKIIYDKIQKLNVEDKKKINNNKIEFNFSLSKCFFLSEKLITKIYHVILTRFLFEFNYPIFFQKVIHQKDYILNGIRVMKKYLLPSLENQSCKNFTWIIMLGNKANITQINELFNFNSSFKKKIIYQKDLKNYTRNKSKSFDILISTRID